MFEEKAETPLITICTLIYNTGPFVVEALKSVKNQSYKNIQHIIIDDFSTDNSVQVVSEWIKENNYACVFIKHKKNMGITKSLNESLRVAEGKYFTGVCDDLFLPNKLKRQVEIFEKLSDDYAMVYSDIYMKNDQHDSLGTLFSNTRKDLTTGPEGDIFEELYLGNFIHGTASLMRMKCLKEVGFYNEELVVEDIDLYLKLAIRYKFKFDNEISAVYIVRNNSFLQTIGVKGLEENLKSLEPYHRYTERTFHYFVSYFDNAIKTFHNESFPTWRFWYKKRWKYKKDIKSINYYLVAVLNLNRHRLHSLKSLKRPKYLASRIFGKLFKSKNKEQEIFMEKNSKKSSYSQCGEDLIVQYIFNLRNIRKPTYIDIGAHHPFFLSNTALFYSKGNRGINIEANPQLIENFLRYRPNDVNLNIGISNKEEELDFYIMQDNTLSTFSKSESDFMIENGKRLQEIKKIKLTTIDKLIDKYCGGIFPDFLTIDVEGLDLDIIKSINFEKGFPKIICVEAAEYSPTGSGARRNELIDHLVGQGYYEYANTNLNAIMVKKEFWFV